ncbi:MAG: hypothetical protein AAAB35_26830 [Phyllobacterium sp.]|uniref:hypothetical protein n=1 Tax=Phyllobacterium sp. TaxID=1871046 RepID=UPI0030F186C6
MRVLGSGKAHDELAGMAVLLLGLAGTLATTPALADDLMLTGFPSIVLSGGSAKAQTRPMQKPFDNEMKTSAMDVVLERTTLDDIVARFGGTIHKRGNRAASIGWICYEVKVGDHFDRHWFIADGSSDEGENVLTTIAGEEGDKPQAGCELGAEELASWTLPVPDLKAGRKELDTAFGTATDNGIIRYAHLGRPDAKGHAKLQALAYRLKDGQVNGVALSQHTTK